MRPRAESREQRAESRERTRFMLLHHSTNTSYFIYNPDMLQRVRMLLAEVEVLVLLRDSCRCRGVEICDKYHTIVTGPMYHHEHTNNRRLAKVFKKSIYNESIF